METGCSLGNVNLQMHGASSGSLSHEEGGALLIIVEK